MADECNFLSGVCALQQAVHNYLLVGDFYDSSIKDMLDKSGGITFVPYDSQADETAKTLITMRRGDLIMQPRSNINETPDVVAYNPSVTLEFTVSAQSYRLAEKLGQELIQLLAILSKSTAEVNLHIGGLQLTPTQNSLEGSPNYFSCKVTANCGIPLTMWKLDNSDDILTIIKINTDFNGQDILS